MYRRFIFPLGVFLFLVFMGIVWRISDQSSSVAKPLSSGTSADTKTPTTALIDPGHPHGSYSPSAKSPGSHSAGFGYLPRYQPPPRTDLQILERPRKGDPLAKILQYKRGLEEGLQPNDEHVSLRQAGTAPFLLPVGDGLVSYHAALNEVFVRQANGTVEILEIPATSDLDSWQTEAERISPDAELVLYPPDQPRDEENALILGSTLIVEAPTEAEARGLAAEEGWDYVRPLDDEKFGRYLVSTRNPTVSLQALLAQKTRIGATVSGNFRKVLHPRNATAPAIGRAFLPIRGGSAAGGVTGRFVPNDAFFPNQWHLWQTNAVGTGNTSGIDVNVINAWDQYKGAGVIIGIVDDGLQISHPDLNPNVATNAFIHRDWNDSTPNDPTPSSLHAHGTAVAGLAAARGNNTVGISGVAPEAKLAGLRLTASVPSDADEIEAFGWR